MAEEGKKDTVALQCIYVGEKAKSAAGVKNGQTFQNRIALINGTVAKAAADARSVAVKQRVVERASEVGDRLDDGRHSKGEHFPVAEMWRDKDDAATGSLGRMIAGFQFFGERSSNASGKIGRSCVREMSKIGDDATEIFEGLLEQLASFV